MTSVTYRPEIDGLRALAVLVVVFFHVGFAPFSGGFVGVDVFFVISGYLITRLIRADHEAGRFSYATFYVRRARRLFPALFVVLAASFVAAFFILSPRFFEEFADSLVCTTFFVSNICFWWQSGYFDADAIYKPLLHMWSLSVEEQFYLVWPTVLVALLALRPRVERSRFPALTEWGVPLFLLVAGAISVYRADRTLDNDAAAVFYLAHFRIGEFAVGAALVWIEKYRPRRALVLDALMLAGLTMILAAVFLYTEATPFPGTSAMLPCIGAGLVIFAGGGARLARLLDNRVAIGIGLISYSLYLVHWPIVVFYAYAIARDFRPVEQWGMVAASIAIATAMYFWVEQPFRRRRPRGIALSNRQVGLASAALAVVLVAPAAYVSASGGMDWRMSDDVAAMLKTMDKDARARRTATRSNRCHMVTRNQSIEEFARHFKACSPLGERNFAVVGDSHAADLWLALSRAYKSVNVIQLTGAGCDPWTEHPKCVQLRQFTGTFIADNADRLDGVAITARLGSDAAQDIDRYADGVAALAADYATAGVPVVVFGPQPEYSRDVPTLVATRRTMDGLDGFLRAYLDREVLRVDRLYADALARRGIAYVSKIALLCPGGDCAVLAADGAPLVTDYGHWTVEASRVFGKRLRARYRTVENLFGARETAGD
ncbi:acyltransferase family protein [Microbaculum sp. FT89]|uniref:acyltransferase family protein n=1 Tax=Microbaculum sp. FT89 TaxID=3447298 RepID=UPI003F53E0E5